MKYYFLFLSLPLLLFGAELTNGNFETGGEGWGTYMGSPEVTATSRTGAKAMLLRSEDRKGGTGLKQVIEYKTPDKRPIIIGGWSRALNVDGAGDFSLYLDIFYEDGTPWWCQTATWSKGSHDWEYTANVFHPKKPVKKIEVFILLRHCTGSAWVDDVFLARGGVHVTNLRCRREFPRRRNGAVLEALLSENATWETCLQTKAGKTLGTAKGKGTNCLLKLRVPDKTRDVTVHITGRGATGETTRFSAPLTLPSLPENPIKKGFRVWTATGMEKILPDTPPPTTSESPQLSFQLAGGGHGGAQLAFKSADALPPSEVRVAVAPIRDAAGNPSDTLTLTPLVVGYVRVDTSSGHPAFARKTGWFPDPLFPNVPVAVQAGITQAFWFDAHALPDAKPGLYHTSVRLTAGNHPAIEIPVQFRVRQFRLPKTPEMKTAFCIMDGFLRKTYGELTPGLRRQALDIMLDHRLNPDDISRFDPPRIEDLLHAEKKGLNAFNILNIVPRPQSNAAWVCCSGKEAYNSKFIEDFLNRAAPVVAELRAHNLADKAYFYGFDERREDYDEIIRTVCKALKQRFPEVKTFTTATYIFGKRAKVPLDYEDYMDWYCPLTPRYDPELAAKLRTVGKQVWWYVCCGPQYPHANFAAVDYPLIEGRLLAWLTHRYRSDGLLYWHVNYWGKNPVIREWGDPYLENWKLPCIARMTGDGVLVYPLANTLAPSLRLKAVRDGSEDYDLLAALAQKQGTKKADALVSELVRGMTDFSRDPQKLEELRGRIFDALEK